MATSTTLEGLRQRLLGGQKVYNGGVNGPTAGFSGSHPTPTRAGISNLPDRRASTPPKEQNTFKPSVRLAFDPQLAGQEREVNRNFQELTAFTNRDRGRIREDYTNQISDLLSQLNQDARDADSVLGSRNIGGTPARMAMQRLVDEYSRRERDTTTGQERGLADVESRFVTGQGRFQDQLAEIGRQRAEVTRQRDLQRAEEEARLGVLTDRNATDALSLFKKAEIDPKLVEIADPRTLQNILNKLIRTTGGR